VQLRRNVRHAVPFSRSIHSRDSEQSAFVNVRIFCPFSGYLSTIRCGPEQPINDLHVPFSICDMTAAFLRTKSFTQFSQLKSDVRHLSFVRPAKRGLSRVSKGHCYSLGSSQPSYFSRC
jgi:hypothetical protein